MLTLAAAAPAVAAACLVLFALYAIAASIAAERQRRALGDEPETADNFITARSSVGSTLLAFSFYASAMGSWVTTAPASYASTAGLIGLTSYAIAAGAPLLLAAAAGTLARKADKEAASLPDFLRRRFAGRSCFEGRLASLTALAIMLFNMVVALLAEYSTLGSLFRDYVKTTDAIAVIMVLLMATLTMTYTMLGGLMVSILTDRIQAIAALTLTAVLAVYALFWLRAPEPLPDLSREQIGVTKAGLSSLFTMPVSLLASTLFSEAIWQRVWASESSKTLWWACSMGSVAVSAVVFFFGFMGFLALWDGKADLVTTNSNLYFFALFSDSESAQLDSVFGLLALLCAAIMSEGAADSLQNGITATLSSTLLAGRPLWATRVLVLAVNVPLAVFGASPQVSSVLEIFLLGNLVSVACALPLFASLLTSQRARAVMTESAMVCGCIGGCLGLSAYGWLREGSLGAGLRMAWIGNGYAYDYFLVAIFSSAACLILACAVGALVSKHSKTYHADNFDSADSACSNSSEDSDASSVAQ